MGLLSKLFGKKYSKQELRLYTHQAQRLIEIYNDSQKLFNTTKTPNVFFERYDLGLKCLKELEELKINTNNAIKYKGDNIHDAIKLLEGRRTNETSLFIERYFDVSKENAEKLKTEKGRMNNSTRSRTELMKFSDYLTKEQVERIDVLWETIQTKP